MRQGQKVDFGVFIGQASFREPKELNPGDRFIQLDKHYDGPVELPPASGLSLPGLPISSATKRACHLWTVVKEAAKNRSSHKDSRQGAALAYYSVFSLGPVIVIAIAVAAFFFGGRFCARMACPVR